MKRFCSLAATVVLLAPVTALAQTISLGQRSLTDGLALPPESAATVDDAASGTLNPAGLGLMKGFQLEYFHDREVSTVGGLTADGVYGAGTFFDFLSVGYSAEWVRPTYAPSFCKNHIGIALAPDRTISLGVAYNIFTSGDPLFGSLTSWDAGLTWRPWSFLSVAASARDFDNPTLGLSGVQMPRRFDWAIAGRPFGNLLTVAADYLFFIDGGDPNLNGLGNGRLGITAEVALPWGVSVTGGAAFPIGQNAVGSVPGQSYGQIGVKLDTEHAGLLMGLAPQGSNSSFAFGTLDVGLRLSAESFTSIPAPGAKVLNVDLAALLNHKVTGLAALLPQSPEDPYEQLLHALSRAAESSRVSAVVFRLGEPAGLSLGRIEELRGAIATLRTHGKKTVALLGGGGDAIYYLASACDRVYAPPQTDFLLHGFSSSSLYFAEGLQKLGVAVQVVRVGPYKSAPDMFTRNEPSPEQTEVTRSLMGDAMGRYLSAVSTARGITQEGFKKILDRGLSTAAQLEQAGLIDGLLYPDELNHAVSKLVQSPVMVQDVVLSPDEHQLAWSNLPGIGLVNVFGLITGGESEDGLLAKTAGAASVVRAIQEAENDHNIKAIVVRVDSGGGDGAASELIWREIGQAKKRKPVVVSFGDVAASGGYYLAVAGDEILAEPSTITGSIGVFAFKADLSGLAQKLGVHPHEEAVTPNADMFSMATPWTDDEKTVLQAYIDSFYATFVKRVADGRKLPEAAVDAVGRGRVWSGSQAKEKGLVDGLGSLADAVEHAMARAHLGASDEVRVVTFGPAPKSEAGLAALGIGESQVKEVLRSAVDAAGAGPALVMPGVRPLALPEALPQLH